MNCNIQIPDERLRVFISSAQNEENGLKWTEIRRKIKNYLNECPYLNPFIIENFASHIQSNQFFQSQVERADLVVLMVKGELRNGTFIEYTLATKLKKPLMTYFIKDDSPSDDVLKLKQSIQDTDYCTYRELDSIEDIEKCIRKDVIENTIRCYQQNTTEKTPSFDTEEKSVVVPKVVEPSRISVPSKTSIRMFSSSYGWLFDFLGVSGFKTESKEESQFHTLGENLLKWMATGTVNDFTDEIGKVIGNLTDLYGETNWLYKRWEAIQHELNGQITEALEAEKRALELAKSAKVSKWIIDDILIDYRNIENQVYQQKREFWVEGEAQKELNDSDTIVYLPVLDRYLGNVYDEVLKEEFKISTLSHNTIVYGSNLGKVITDIENYFFSAVLYGSYSHMVITRKLLSTALRKYGEVFSDIKLVSESMKLLILNGTPKDFKLFLDNKWDDVYSTISSSADEMWELAKLTPIVYRDSMQQLVMEKIGMYFSKKTFVEAEKYLNDFEKNVYWGVSEAYFDCVLSNINRLDANKIIVSLTKIIKDRRFHIGSKISNILCLIQLKSVTLENQINLKNALLEQLPFIIENAGTPQLIAALMAQNKDVFKELETLPNNGLEGVQEKLFKVNMGSDNWEPTLLEEIETAKKQFEANKQKGVYKEFGANPYSMISYILRQSAASDGNINKILLEKYIPLAVDVLNSDATAIIKERCVSCLCDVLSAFIQHNVDIPSEIIDVIQKVDLSKVHDFFATNSKDVLSIRVFIAKLIVGITDKDELLKWCVEYSKRSTKERIALADCVEKYLYSHNDEQKHVDLMLLSLVIQCLEDECYEVRCSACKALSYVLDSNYKETAENKLYQVAADPSHYVRNNLLRLCNEGIIHGDVSKKIIALLKNDANYAIREYALSVDED